MNKITDVNIILNFYKDNYEDQQILVPTEDYIKKHTYYVLYKNNILVSLVSVNSYYDKIAEVSQLVVHKKYRGFNFGNETIQELEKELKEKGFRKMIAWIISDNFISLFGALKQGFLIEGLTRDNLPNTDVYCCGKLLVER